MCWNEPVSWASWVLILVGSVILWNRNHTHDRWWAVFIMTFGLMQMIEALMWRDEECKTGLNSIATKLGLVAILMQPLAATLGALTMDLKPEDVQMVVAIVVTYVIAVLAPALHTGFDLSDPAVRENMRCTKKAKGSCHMHHKFVEYPINNTPSSIVWVIVMVLPFVLFAETWADKAAFATVVMGTYMLSRLVDNVAWSSLWCWIAIGGVFFAYAWN